MNYSYKQFKRTQIRPTQLVVTPISKLWHIFFDPDENPKSDGYPDQEKTKKAFGFQTLLRDNNYLKISQMKGIRRINK